MTTRQGLLAAILSNPDDDIPRLVYADWLDENDLSLDAELIRTAVRVGHLRSSITISERDAYSIALSEDYRSLLMQNFNSLVELSSSSNPNRRYGLGPRLYWKTLIVNPDIPDTGINTPNKVLDYQHPEVQAFSARCWELWPLVIPKRFPGYDELDFMARDMKVCVYGGMVTTLRCSPEWWGEYGRRVHWNPKLKRECPETAENITLVLLTSNFTVRVREDNPNRNIRIWIDGDREWTLDFGMREYRENDARAIMRSRSVLSRYVTEEFPGVRFQFPDGVTLP